MTGNVRTKWEEGGKKKHNVIFMQPGLHLQCLFISVIISSFKNALVFLCQEKKKLSIETHYQDVSQRR